MAIKIYPNGKVKYTDKKGKTISRQQYEDNQTASYAIRKQQDIKKFQDAIERYTGRGDTKRVAELQKDLKSKISYWDNKMPKSESSIKGDLRAEKVVSGETGGYGGVTPPITPGAAPTPSAVSTIDTITDPVTGKTYSRDTSIQGSTYKLQPTQAPSNASGVQAGISAPQLPSGSPSFGSTSSAMAGVSGLNAFMDASGKAEDDYQSQVTALQKQQADLQKSWISKLVSPQDAREDAQSETGINVKNYFAEEKKKIAEIETLNKEYNSVVAAKDQQIAMAHDKMGSNNFINNQIQQIERNAAPKLNMMSANINAKAATLQASQGMFAEAEQYVNQAVQDATAENAFKVDMFQIFYKQNQDSIDRLDSKYKDALDKAYDFAKLEYQNALEEKREIGSLLLAYPNAGININDSLEDAYSKATASGGALIGGDTTDLKEYSFAQQQGYEGTFLEWQKSMANLKTPKPPTINVHTSNVVESGGIEKQLDASKGGDGFVNADVYASLRSTSGLTPSVFNGKFSYKVNPSDKKRLGISGGSAMEDLYDGL